MTKKRKNRNPENQSWRKERKPKQKKTEVRPFTTVGLIKLMGAASSPAKKIAVLGAAVSTPTKAQGTVSRTNLTFSSPGQSKGFTPEGSTLLPFPHKLFYNGKPIKVFLPPEKVDLKEIDIPEKPNAWILNSPVPDVGLDGVDDEVYTSEELKTVKKAKSEHKRQGKSARYPSQKDVMKLPAQEAAELAGIKAPPESLQWLHWRSHSMKGDKAQKANNMGLGTKMSNAAMELINRVIVEVLKEQNFEVSKFYVDFQPKWVKDFEKIRLMKSLTLIVKEKAGPTAQHKFSCVFNTLSLSPICESLVPLFRELFIKTMTQSTSCKKALFEKRSASLENALDEHVAATPSSPTQLLPAFLLYSSAKPSEPKVSADGIKPNKLKHS